MDRPATTGETYRAPSLSDNQGILSRQTQFANSTSSNTVNHAVTIQNAPHHLAPSNGFQSSNSMLAIAVQRENTQSIVGERANMEATASQLNNGIEGPLTSHRLYDQRSQHSTRRDGSSHLMGSAAAAVGSAYPDNRGRGRGMFESHRGSRGGPHGRGGALDISHARGRGRGGPVMSGKSRPQEERLDRPDGFERGQRHQPHSRPIGRENRGGRHAQRGGGRGRGGMEYDADFDRGKSFQDRRAEAQKQLYQAPMGYKGDVRSDSPDKSTKQGRKHEDQEPERPEEGDTRRQAEVRTLAGKLENNMHESHPSILDVSLHESAAQRGIIDTGIDINALQQDSRSRRQPSDRKERHKGRDGKSRPVGNRDTVTERQVHEIPPRYGEGPPHFMHPHPHPHHGPPDFMDGRHPPPPPPGAFHAYSHGLSMPRSGEDWHGSAHDSPTSRHRGPPPHQHRTAHLEHHGEPRKNSRTKPEVTANHVKSQDIRSFRKGSSRDSHEPESESIGSPVPAARQLFVPGKDDPVKFSALKASSSGLSGLAGIPYDMRSVASSSTRSSLSSLSVASSGYRSRSSSQKDALLDEVDSTSSGAVDNALLRELKASYRGILSVEAKLQDEDSFAQNALKERAISTGVTSDLELHKESRPDGYWANLVQLHREGAEAFHSFMERCMDPMVPASIHSIPQKYNLPSRMWKSVFLLLFERLSQALPDPSNNESRTLHHVDATEDSESATGSVVDHLTDFVYYAYTFCTQLLEQQSLSAFRETWIEHLGDIARYRMMIAKVSRQISHVTETSPTSGKLLRSLLEDSQGNDRPNEPTQQGVEAKGTPRKQLVARKDRKKGFPGMPSKLGEDLEIADTPGNSIGTAALDDWELIEQDIWRTVSQEWYFLGLSETPGTGRLHHHLAMITEDDPLRTLYHYSKSLAASHPYSSGDTSILRFFPPEKQAARILPDMPALSLFVHLHGLLYTGDHLDTFEPIFARLEEKLEDTFKYVQAQASRPARRSLRAKERDDPSQRLDRDSTWIMMAVTNISALMEYGKEGGALKIALASANDRKRIEKQSSKVEKKSTQNRNDPTPSEANLTDLARQIQRLGLEASKARSTSHQVNREVAHVSEEIPHISASLRLAMRLTFGLLNHVILYPMKPGEIDPAMCPYITILLTFLATMSHNPTALAIVRSEVPWEALKSFHESLPKSDRDLYLRKDSNVPNRLLGIALPEDWCIRGMEWTGKQLFGRGYWKGKQGTAYMSTSQSESLGGVNQGESHSYSMPESEKDVLAERYEGPSMPAHAGGPQSAYQQGRSGGTTKENQLDEDGEPPADRETVARLRWKRVALTAAWIARAVPFVLVDGETGQISLDKQLYQTTIKSDAQKAAETIRSTSAEHQSKTETQAAQEIGGLDREQDDDEDEEEESLLGSGDESETVKQLKERRRELKALLRQSRGSRNEEKLQALAHPSTNALSSSKSRSTRKTTLNAVAGYTTLVFDTNILLESMDVFTALLISKRWTLVVPLAVVTELDGLRTKEDPLGTSATQAIKYLEDAIKTYSMNLKVQTSRGNYLRDLNIRREDIDFGHSTSSGHSTGGSKDGSIKSMDDVILNVAVWQKTHWLDRRALLGIKSVETSQVTTTTPVKTILVSSDKTLRLKGRVRGLEVCDALAIEQLLEKQPDG